MSTKKKVAKKVAKKNLATKPEADVSDIKTQAPESKAVPENKAEKKPKQKIVRYDGTLASIADLTTGPYHTDVSGNDEFLFVKTPNEGRVQISVGQYLKETNEGIVKCDEDGQKE